MQVVKAYLHRLLRFLIGAILVGYGAWGFWIFARPILRTGRIRLGWIGSFDILEAILFSGAPLAAGILILRWRARGVATAYCLIAAIVFFLRPQVPIPGIFETAFLLFAAAFLVLPAPRMPVLNPPAVPDERNWRKFLLASLQGEGIRPARDRFTGRFLAIGAQVFAFLTMLVIVLIVVMPLAMNGAPGLVLLPLIAAIVFGWAGLGRFLHLRLRDVGGDRYRRLSLGFARAQVQARSAEEELQRSRSRRPILYLRAFAIDDRAYEERALVRTMRKVGPVIAIGRPGETFPPLGAARFYVDHDHWQEKVADIVKVARLVVWVTGTTEGLKWELNHLRQSLPPDRLILWAHPHLLGLYGKPAETEWARFLERLGSIFPVPLPRELGEARYFIFDENWSPIAIIATGPHAQAAALMKLLDYKGIQKLPSRFLLRLKSYGAMLLLAFWVVFILGALWLRFVEGY